MDKRVTVLFSDQRICVGKTWLKFNFPIPAGMHAIQWIPGSCQQIEYSDGTPNKRNLDYEADVAPYVALFMTERRLQAAKALEEIDAELVKLDQDGATLLQVRDSGTATEQDLESIAYLEARVNELRDKRKSLLASGEDVDE